MKNLKDVIYQDGFDHGLEKAQIPIGHELFRLRVNCPSEVFRVSVETADGIEVSATGQVEG